MTRHDFDQLLAQRAVKAGARLLERTEAVAPRSSRTAGSPAPRCGPRATGRGAHRDPRPLRARRRRRGEPLRGAGRRATRPRRGRSGSRPAGTSASTTTRGRGSSRGSTCGTATSCCPGTAGCSRSPAGGSTSARGLLNTFANFKDISAQHLFDAFSRMLPPEWGIGEDTAEGRVLSGPLPMGFNRTPRAVPGLLLIGDAAGAVNPFNGEGIAYAIETGEIAADLRARGAHHRPARRSRCSTRACSRTPTAPTSPSGGGSRR